MSASPRLLVITCTYQRPRREEYLQRCIGIFRQVENFHWLVVEDGAGLDPAVTKMLAESGMEHTYLHAGPAHNWGGTQKEMVFDYIRARRLEGIVYIADDDNGFDPRLFDEIRKTKRISVFPVGDLGPWGIEKPKIKNGKIVGWISSWNDRKFPIDTGGFAVNAALLHETAGSLWPSKIRGGETEFLEKLVTRDDEFEPLCDRCRVCYVIHNLPLGEEFYPFLRRAIWLRQKQLAEIWLRQSWIGDLYRKIRRR